MLRALRQIAPYLPPPCKRRWFALVLLHVVSAAAEAVGAAAIFMLLGVLQSPRGADSSAPALLAAVTPSGTDSLIFFVCLLAAFYLLKSGFQIGVVSLRSRVSHETVAELVNGLFRAYLAAPFALRARQDSATQLTRVYTGADRVVCFLLEGTIGLLSEIMVVAGIGVVLAIFAPFATLVVTAVLAAAIVALMRLGNRRVSRLGNEIQAAEEQRLRALQQGLEGIRIIKVMGLERFFWGLVSTSQGELSRLRVRQNIIADAPRLVVEACFVLGALVIVLILRFAGAGADSLAALGLFAYAGFRVIPSCNRILLSLTNIAYGSAAVEPIVAELERTAEAWSGQDAGIVEPLHVREAIRLERISFRYPGSTALVIDKVDLVIHHGESVGIFGTTGAGKSTLLDLTLGLLEPSKGRITVDGADIFEQRRAWQRSIGYVPQETFLINDTLRRNVAFGVAEEEIDDVWLAECLAAAQLGQFISRLPGGSETRVGERGARLSGGERQRIAIARALYRKPSLLVFDEATSALDHRTEMEFLVAIRSLRGTRTMITVTHRPEAIRICDRVVFLSNGRVVASGNFDALLATSDEFRNLAAPTANRAAGSAFRKNVN